MAVDADLQLEPSMTTRQPLYEGSTQFKNWRYSPEQLLHVRSTLNAVAVTAIRNAFEADEPGSSSKVAFLNPDEEQLLVKLYVSKITQLCGLFRFPEEVEATSASYLKRFYLRNTVMDWHPKNVMLTTLFLATKTTNNPIPLETYASHIPRTAPSDVLDLEFLVAQSLGFEFTVWHAHRALWGVWLDLQSLPDAPVNDLRGIYDTALTHVRAARLTDAEFIYTPSQIALACLSLAAPALASQWVASKKLQHVDHDSQPAFSPETTIDEIKMLVLATGHIPPVDSVREVDRRLKLCKNPEKVVGSKAYLARKAEEERKAEQKRNRKAEDYRKVAEDDDPFGDELAGENGRVADDDDDD